jgi:hypothetical protein
MRTAHYCSVIAVALASIAASIGLLRPDIYRDNEFVRAAWTGSDVVTLFLAGPLLIAAMMLARRRSAIALVTSIATLDYFLYCYAYYLFGAAFNPLFLLYVVIVASSSVALVFTLLNLDAPRLMRDVVARSSDRWIAGYMFFVAGGLTTVYSAQSIAFIINAQVPPIVTLTGHPTSVVFALDLTLLVPPLVVAATWLWQHRPWGRVLAAALNTKGAIYTLSMIVSSLAAVRAGYGAAANEVPLWMVLTLGNAVSAVVLLSPLRARKHTGMPGPP